jgi:hypothetical protein
MSKFIRTWLSFPREGLPTIEVNRTVTGCKCPFEIRAVYVVPARQVHQASTVDQARNSNGRVQHITVRFTLTNHWKTVCAALLTSHPALWQFWVALHRTLFLKAPSLNITDAVRGAISHHIAGLTFDTVKEHGFQLKRFWHDLMWFQIRQLILFGKTKMYKNGHATPLEDPSESD